MQRPSSHSGSKPDIGEGGGMKQKNCMCDSSPACFTQRNLHVIKLHVRTTGPYLLKVYMSKNLILTKMVSKRKYYQGLKKNPCNKSSHIMTDFNNCLVASQ